MAAAVAEFFGVTAGPNFEGRSILFRPLGAPLEGPAPVETGRRLLFEARRSGPGPASTTRCSPNGTPCTARPWPKRRRPPAGTTGPTAAIAIGEFLCSQPASATTAGGCGAGRPTAGPAIWPTPPTTPGWSTASPGWASSPVGAVWTERAIDAADGLIELFHDDEGGGFFTTGHDAEPLIVRTKDVFDGATPSANGWPPSPWPVWAP